MNNQDRLELRKKVEGLVYADPDNAGYIRSYAYGHNDALKRVLVLLSMNQPEQPYLIVHPDEADEMAALLAEPATETDRP